MSSSKHLCNANFQDNSLDDDGGAVDGHDDGACVDHGYNENGGRGKKLLVPHNNYAFQPSLHRHDSRAIAVEDNLFIFGFWNCGKTYIDIVPPLQFPLNDILSLLSPVLFHQKQRPPLLLGFFS